MILKPSNLASSRREFLLNVLPAGSLFCLGCKGLLASSNLDGQHEGTSQKHKFLEDSGMSVEDVYKFAYGTFVPVYQIMAKNMGREKFLEMLGKASSENMAQFVASIAKDSPKRDMTAFADLMVNVLGSFPYNKALTYEVVEKTEKVFETKYTECLMAKVFREMNAADIGYAMECYPSDAVARAFNPKMKSVFIKNLMKGDDVCIERITLEV
ncbi:MAG: hypothetical protein A2V45_12560 [Candidatus Aminicenantes bacterium RBG_19FT_COMBO_58_17]|jgi:hypothetical protein|nr:MAG: hypothetical protein A2V45_12560 [Candidatus Aminicenantes bacterium RBG_19FT_COMBO_58_17]